MYKFFKSKSNKCQAFVSWTCWCFSLCTVLVPNMETKVINHKHVCHLKRLHAENCIYLQHKISKDYSKCLHRKQVKMLDNGIFLHVGNIDNMWSLKHRQKSPQKFRTNQLCTCPILSLWFNCNLPFIIWRLTCWRYSSCLNQEDQIIFLIQINIILQISSNYKDERIISSAW